MTPERFYVHETGGGYRKTSAGSNSQVWRELLVLDRDYCHEVAWTSGLIHTDVELIHARGDAGRVCDRFNREYEEGVAAA